MSEKQFRLSKYVTPTSISYFYNQQGQMLNKEVASMLNKLYDENVQLKEENEQLQKELDNFKPIMFKNMQKGTIILYSKGGIDE